jgi:hypothetical protein
MKRQSKSQQIGEAGEDAFRRFARRMGLIANKVEHDYGTDFFCIPKTGHDGQGNRMNVI